MTDCDHDHDPAGHTDTEWDWDCTALCVGLLPAIGLSRVSQGQASKLTRLPALVCLSACRLRNAWHGCPGTRRGDSEATVTIIRALLPFCPCKAAPGLDGSYKYISISQGGCAHARSPGRVHSSAGKDRDREAAPHAVGRGACGGARGGTVSVIRVSVYP